jgi:hypothetical protein
MILYLSMYFEINYRRYIIVRVTFFQLGVNIYDNQSYLQINKHFSNTDDFRRVRKFAKSDYYLYRICLSIRKVHFLSRWKNFLGTHKHTHIYTGCNRRNGPNLGRVFLMLNYTDITQNTYVQSITVPK